MIRKRQLDQNSLIARDAKFVESKKCLRCGGPTRSVALRCVTCLEALRLSEELAYLGDYLKAHPETMVELAHDRRRQLHLVLPRISQWAWCGAVVTQMKAKRDRMLPRFFPPHLCEECRKVYEGMCNENQPK